LINVAQLRMKSKVEIPYPELPEVSQSGIRQAGTGKIYDKKPFKFFCEKGKEYFWCACGNSHTQVSFDSDFWCQIFPSFCVYSISLSV